MQGKTESLVGKNVKIKNNKKYAQNFIILEVSDYEFKVCHEDLKEFEKCHQWINKEDVIILPDDGSVMCENNRLTCFMVENNRVEVKEDELKIFDKSKKIIPEWKPSRSIKPFNEVLKIYIDIETSGLVPEKDRIYYIGLKLSGYKSEDGYILITDKSEKKLLEKFVEDFRRLKPEIVAGFNSFKFDLLFIIKRCELLGVKHDFKVTDFFVTVKTAQHYGDAETFQNIKLKIRGCKYSTSLVDMYHHVLSWDNVIRVLTSYTLKQSVIQMGLRDEQRLELDHHQINKCWENGELETIEEYLQYDLDDTELLSDYLLPAIYYQLLFVPDMDVQRLATSGNGTKWNLVFESLYQEIGKGVIEPDIKIKYKGGYTIGYAGLHRNVSKIDVSSLYPSIMLTYGITSRKDKDNRLLGILRYLLTERLKLKDLGKANKEANQLQGALKVLINSAYGALGADGVAFNDYEAAALVTAYGRRIAKLMMDIIEEEGGTLVEVDTDGVMFKCVPGDNERIFQKVKNTIPNGIGLEHEWQAEAVFIPPVDKGSFEGLRKNYLVFTGKKVKATGKFRKRDVCKLEKTFQIDYIKKYLINPSEAETFYKETIKLIQSGDYPIEDLSITRKIRRKEVDLLRLGATGQVITFYQTVTGKNIVGDYSISYYQDKIIKIRKDLLDIIDPYLLKLDENKVDEIFIDNNSIQLSLFN